VVYTEALLRLLSEFDYFERRRLEANAHMAGRRLRARLGSPADMFWSKASELGWAERGEIETIGLTRTRPYRISQIGAKALPVLLTRRAQGERHARRLRPQTAEPLAGRPERF